MKKAFLLVAMLLASTQVFAGTRILSCESDEGDTSVQIIKNKNRKLVAVISTEVTAGGILSFRYKVNEQSSTYVGRNFVLTVNAKNQGHLEISDLSIDQDVDCE